MGAAPGCGEHACLEAGSLKRPLGSHLGNQVQKELLTRPIAGDSPTIPDRFARLNTTTGMRTKSFGWRFVGVYILVTIG